MKLETEEIAFSFNKKQVFDNVNFAANDGEFICILGVNGSGKSTFLNCLCRLLIPRKGKITLNERNIRSLSRKELARYISYVPQNYNPVYECSIRDFLLMGRNPYAGFFANYNKSDRTIVDKALEQFELTAYAEKSISQLSGGERKRILLIRTLIQDTPFIILDEPANQLDFGMRVQFLNLLKSLSKQGKCIIATTHSPEDALNYADKILIFSPDKTSVYPAERLTTEMIDTLYHIRSEIIQGKTVSYQACIASTLTEEEAES